MNTVQVQRRTKPCLDDGDDVFAALAAIKREERAVDRRLAALRNRYAVKALDGRPFPGH